MIFCKMLSKQENSKSTKIFKINYLLIFILINTLNIYGQGRNSIKSKRIKVDGVSAVVGDYVI